MFIKIDKKILVILLIIVVVVGIGTYALLVNRPNKVENQENQMDTTTDTSSIQIQKNNPASQLLDGEVKVEGTNGGGTLTICSDKCNDGICQTTNADCKDGNLNCVCPETKSDCPQDCK